MGQGWGWELELVRGGGPFVGGRRGEGWCSGVALVLLSVLLLVLEAEGLGGLWLAEGGEPHQHHGTSASPF